ncbi:hypothetical protein CCHR01_16406 [Colletotrichum chrysophilum]|uniref:Uncharacterized protein n=1 Tax=Colletotrichum chrysophilum TaxID=1836956 RepID=A0AAD9A3T1_9PEZI|nr:hypothetical protein CCHR01_16406 [Colletotrichum chrysophilum]
MCAQHPHRGDAAKPKAREGEEGEWKVGGPLPLSTVHAKGSIEAAPGNPTWTRPSHPRFLSAAALRRRPGDGCGWLLACLLAASYGEHRPVRPKPLSMRPPATADTGGRSGRRCCCCCCWQRSSDRPAHGRQRKAETEERRMGGRKRRKRWLAAPLGRRSRRSVKPAGSAFCPDANPLPLIRTWDKYEHSWC